MSERWSLEMIELMEVANGWKTRAEAAEAKVELLLQRQDEMAAQIETLRLHALPIEGIIR